ncbi:MAG TPA: ABC transporter permease [Polyangiaceae bacterium]|jgi:lipoprotein-releasing system permease protein|nr:ABC transporter permease [Polyangiaceae bacterium]HNZ23330.1 ABC transporter permease [Polyangiaceae bacterium]HOD21900.1 ABC transporter permease [Polyangiaceae bacterium]HOE49345.1 ABC transporter permease [Polyangiaceae bacterium]HOH00932.1 ABC transporter permease [Polyangiaceae bacterium]
MGYPLQIATRYLGAKSKGAFVSVGTAFAILGVTLGVAALLTVMSVTGGFQSEFRKKVLGVNAHVLVLKYSSDFREYREIMAMMREVPGIIGVAPFTINPMMVSHKEKTATGVLVKGVDPELMPTVLDLPSHIKEGGSLHGLRKPGATPPERKTRGGITPAPKPLPLGSKTAEPKDGGTERDDAGRNITLLRAIEDSIREDERNAKPKPPEGPPDGIDEILEVEHQPPPLDPSSDTLDAGVAADVMVGSVVPEGGYKSQLPDPEDDLPEDVAPDPCNSPEAVAQLPGIVVGNTLAQNLSVQVGDCLQVTSPTIGFSYSGGVIRPPVAKQFKVIAIFEAGFDQYDSKLVYVDLYEAQRFQDYGDSVTGVEAKVRDIDEAGKIELDVASRLSSNLYSTMDWEDLNHGLFTALRIQKIGMSAVLALIIFVAAFTVIATLIMLVLEKKKEIAVLKAMGASDVAILRIFVYQGGIIGVMGTALGLGLGLAVCKGLLVYGFPLDPKVYFISTLPVEVRPTEFIITGAIALTLCLIATVIPSLYAARLRPADGVRPE